MTDRELLEAIFDEVRTVRRLLEADGGDDLRLLKAIATQVRPGEVFHTSDLIAIAEADGDFAAALRPVAGTGAWAANRLGKALERLQLEQVGPYRIQAGPRTRDGRAWSFVTVSA